MSLAREKYLKRKRELLGNINIIDSNVEEKKGEFSLEKKKTEIKNDEKSYNKKKEEGSKTTLQKNEYRLGNYSRGEQETRYMEKSGNNNSSTDLGAFNEANNNNDRGNDYRMQDEYQKQVEEQGDQAKGGRKDIQMNPHDRKKIRVNNKEQQHPFGKGTTGDNLLNNGSRTCSNDRKDWSISTPDSSHVPSKDVCMSRGHERGVNASRDIFYGSKAQGSNTPGSNLPRNISEPLGDISSMEINDSAILLIYTCKLLLHMCGKEQDNRDVMNTSITSVEILREIKNRNRRNVKLLKINVLNSVLMHLAGKSEDEGGGGKGKKEVNPREGRVDNTFERHKEIKMENSCIEIENVGINIIIKVVHRSNVKKLLLKYLPQLCNNKGGDRIGREGKRIARTPYLDEYKMGSSIGVATASGAGVTTASSVGIATASSVGIATASSVGIATASSVGIATPSAYNSPSQESQKNKHKKSDSKNYAEGGGVGEYDSKLKEEGKSGQNKINYIESLLNEPTAKEKKRKEEKTNILSIIEAPTVIEEMRIKKFQKKEDSVKIICPYLTKKICNKHNKECNKVHFKKIISEHTDVSLGDCSYLDTCRHIETCKFVHYAVDKDDNNVTEQKHVIKKKNNLFDLKENTYGPQWIRCDLRNFDLSIFNQYVSVVMADPPWDIHMDLPYGTMTDNEMKLLPVQLIQDEGMIFLWVTGRAMELARECLQIWGYKRVEEILWVKTNHLQRIIRTGRTGHWLNHSKEHCLVGIKGNPVINRNIDCNVIVSEVRETSRKPDEIYSLIERLCPQNLKIELFGRPHNIRSNWITLGNQLNGVVLHHPQIKDRYNKIAAQFNMPPCND
ncbi:mRNA (N6-adenosine)-methyltransferase, putative [Plasmodium ovale wallikeri]|uniref:mRNA (N6-adenosine)-methyltransferase, putative n=2 Tax=Plasmodium ovale TaxID=36330 RepID=A0A1C3KMY2_PLAOA|nr:mRNA (N6-adenosine)-methyltransferase, putative [Plasmodium ovale wallikeri]SBT75373.1 mRNA (N6-adenosine)-methyltransferase, putative [Plasmodium ovale]